MTTRGDCPLRPATLVLLAMTLGCGSEAAPNIAPEPAAPPTAVPTEAPPEVVAPPPAATPPADIELAVFSVPNDWAPEYERDSMMSIQDAPANRADGEPNDARGHAFDRLADDVRSATESTGDIIGTECAVTLDRPDFTSMRCTMTGSGGRTGFDRATSFVSIRVIDGAARDVVVRDAIAPDVDLDALAARSCRAEAAARVADGEAVDAVWCDDTEFGLTFAPTGLRVHPLDRESYEDVMEVVIRYDDPALAGHLRVDGPLAAILPIGTRSTIVFGAEQILAAELAVRCHVAFAFGPTRPLDETLLLLDRAPAVEASALATSEAGARAVHATCTPTVAAFHEAEASARALAPDGIVERVATAEVLTARRYLTTEELALRATPSTDGTYLRTLPLGTRLMGLEGTIDGHPSGAGARGSWIRVVAGEGVSGWVAGRYVESLEGRCGRPTAAQIAAALPAEAAGASTLFTDYQGSLVAVASGPSRSWVAISASCSLTPLERLITVPDRIDSLRFIGGRSGEPVLLVTSGTSTPTDPSFDGTLHVMLVAPGATEPGWTIDARAHPAVASAERASLETNVRASGTSWDVAVRARGEGVRRARWDGAAFVESTGR